MLIPLCSEAVPTPLNPEQHWKSRHKFKPVLWEKSFRKQLTLSLFTPWTYAGRKYTFIGMYFFLFLRLFKKQVRSDALPDLCLQFSADHFRMTQVKELTMGRFAVHQSIAGYLFRRKEEQEKLFCRQMYHWQKKVDAWSLFSFHAERRRPLYFTMTAMLRNQNNVSGIHSSNWRRTYISVSLK